MEVNGKTGVAVTKCYQQHHLELLKSIGAMTRLRLVPFGWIAPHRIAFNLNVDVTGNKY